MSLKFQDPPQDRRIATQWDEIFEELRKNPGKWALIKEGMNSPATAGNLRRGVYKGSTPGEFEATTRSREENGKKVVDIYARYPEQSE